MFRGLLFPIVLGLGGVAVLLALGFWQVERLAWKEGELAGIEARLAAEPVPLPAAPDEASDEYRPVTLSGSPESGALHVLTSGTAAGTGYRVISPFVTDGGRRVMLDRGLLPLDVKEAVLSTDLVAVSGNLIWPDDVNSSTPPPDREANIWFGRDVAAMAAALGTEPVMIVAALRTDPRVTPLPVDTAGIKNDHLEYAITWFLLAAVWAVMSGFLIYRNRAGRTD